MLHLIPRLFDVDSETFVTIPLGSRLNLCPFMKHRWVAFVSHSSKQEVVDRITYCERCGVVKSHFVPLYHAVYRPIPWWKWNDPTAYQFVQPKHSNKHSKKN